MSKAKKPEKGETKEVSKPEEPLRFSLTMYREGGGWVLEKIWYRGNTIEHKEVSQPNMRAIIMHEFRVTVGDTIFSDEFTPKL